MKKIFFLLLLSLSFSLFPQENKEEIKTTEIKEINLAEISSKTLEKYQKIYQKKELISFRKAIFEGIYYGKDTINITGNISKNFLGYDVQLNEDSKTNQKNQKWFKDVIDHVLTIQNNQYKILNSDNFYMKNYCQEKNENSWLFSPMSKSVRGKYNIDSAINFLVKLDENGHISTIEYNDSKNENNSILKNNWLISFEKKENKLRYNTLEAILTSTVPAKKIVLKITFD